MIKNNFLFFIRNIKRNKISFLINLIGLSTGLACTLLIYIWVNDELNIDKFHEKDSQLYQVMINDSTPDGIVTRENTQGLLSEALANEIPEIEHAVASIYPWSMNKKGVLSYGDKHIVATDRYVGKDFFNLFSFKLTQGDRNQVLSDKYSVVISDELALKLFNSTENVIGKTVKWNRYSFSGVFTVSGIFKIPPANSLEKFDILFNYELYFKKNRQLKKWTNSDPKTYLLLKKGINIDNFNTKIAHFLKSKITNTKEVLFVRPYSNKYLFDNYEDGELAGGRIIYVRLFFIIAVFILAIACINFMNLTTAKASKRLKEIGVRKVLGINRNTLILQYLGESVTMAVMSLFIALIIVFLFLPQFNEITGKELNLTFNSKFIFAILSITIITGLVSGIYPAFFLSNQKPVSILNGKLNSSTRELWTRKGMVIFQFIISVVLIISVFAVYKQTKFVNTKDLGFNKENVIIFDKGGFVSDRSEYFNSGGKFEKDVETFLQMLKNIPGVVDATNFRHEIPEQHGSTTNISWPGKDPSTKIRIACLIAGYDYIKTLNIKMKEGRAFSMEYGTDKNCVVINEAAAKIMGLKEPVGSTIKLGEEEKQIIGVTKDFNFQSLYESIKPLYISIGISPFSSKIMVRIQDESRQATIEQIRDLYEKHNEGFPFEYKYLDNGFEVMYKSESQIASLSKYFAGIAILISCLGLFGITAFSAQKRTKEIGIRKVHGSTSFGIMKLLSIDYIKLVVISIFISMPIGYVIVRSWLNKYAYKVDLGIWIFISTGLITIMIAWLTVFIQVLKTANINPVISLKDE